MADESNKKKDIKDEEKLKERKKIEDELEKKVVLGLWLQLVGSVIEAIALSDLLKISKDPDNPGENQVVAGVWIQTIGQILETISVTNQIFITDKQELINQQKVAITADILNSLGAAIEAAGGIKVVTEEEQDTVTFIVT
ncbi:hypothetical protein JOC77_004116 [Peribacillus deserti]|uniref:Uncharacterized protein n=1 Tax=Peribacillus deserti TaxID=673318 RepID=A0ABS2QN96_9BACI|nr:hypothetical protein [Peribacillus deserti]MBM7694641.1 hypothetical protein [Peribacillus deserti]